MHISLFFEPHLHFIFSFLIFPRAVIKLLVIRAATVFLFIVCVAQLLITIIIILLIIVAHGIFVVAAARNLIAIEPPVGVVWGIVDPFIKSTIPFVTTVT